MLVGLLPLLPLVLCAPTSASGESAAALAPVASRPAPLQDAARLLPADATVVLRLDSAQAVLDLANAFADMGVPDGSARVTLEDVLSDLIDLPGAAGLVSADRPILLALVIGQGGPTPTYVLPVSDAAAYVASLADSGWSGVASGGYVGVSRSPGYALAAEPGDLLDGLPGGLMSVRVDLGTLIATFRPLIEMGLDQAEMMIDQVAEMSEGPIDIAPVLELYIDAAWALVDSAERLDASVVLEGDALGLRFDFTAKEKSPMAGMGSAGQHDLAAYPGTIDPQASLAMVMACDWVDMLARMGPFMDVATAMYPEPLRKAFDAYMESFAEVQDAMGPVVAMSGDLTPDGMRLTYYIKSEDTAALLSTMREGLAAFDVEGSGMRLTPVETETVDGVELSGFRLDFDFRALAGSMSGGVELEEQDLAKLDQMMKAVYGPDGLQVRLGAKDGTVVVALGGDEAFVERALAGVGAPRQPLAPSLQAALKAADGGNPAFAYHLDLGRMFGQMGALAELFGEDPQAAAFFQLISGRSFPMTFWGSIRGRVWSGGMGTRMSAIREIARAAMALEER